MDWFHNLQVRTKLVLSFSILMLLLITLTVTSYSSTRTMATLSIKTAPSIATLANWTQT